MKHFSNPYDYKINIYLIFFFVFTNACCLKEHLFSREVSLEDTEVDHNTVAS